jgi:signal transduction histidine kinase
MAAEAPPPSRAPKVVGTLRFRITALATLVVLAVLVIAGVGLVVAQRRLLTENLDDALRQRADDLGTLVTRRHVPPTLPNTEDVLLQIVTPDGAVLAASPNVAGEPPIGRPPPAGQTQALGTVEHPRVGADPLRILSRRVEGRDGTVVLKVAAPLDDVNDSTRVLATTLSIALPAVAALLAALIWALVGGTLRPVEAIRARVASIGGTDLRQRVPDPGGDDEIARLSRTMNAMLDRLQDATGRQQRFVADASHDLRSPLTRIRSELEVDLAHPETADLAATHRSVLDEITALQRLVEDLLLLARSDAGALTLRRQPVDLDDIVMSDAARLRADGRVHVESTAVSAAQVHGDPDQLTRAIRNLIDNAARHARTTITLTLTEHDHTAVLGIADDGPGIPTDQHQRVFERFTRLDDARTTTGGSGLGLPIARDIIQRHDGTITIDPDHHPGTRLVITLPTAP